MHGSRSQFRMSRQRSQRGAAAIIAMMFLVIFGSLAAAMAIVSQGNLAIADSQIKIHRALAAAETGMNLVRYQFDEVARQVLTRYGEIDADRAEELWLDPDGGIRQRLYDAFAEVSALQQPSFTTRGLRVGPIAVGPDAPTFTATFEPHPLPGNLSRYDDPFYKRAPYNDPNLFDQPVSSSNPLDARWIRVVVTAQDGPEGRAITRSISMDFRVDKKLRFAILSRSRVMIGRNVMIEGRVGSRFMDTHLEHGHPVQMESDFRGLHPDLDELLDVLKNTLITNDVNGDNRINLASATETNGISNPQQYDANGDGYLDDYDFFLTHFDTNGDGRVSRTELEAGSTSPILAAQLMELIDTFGSDSRSGYNDGFIDDYDRYAKVRGQVMILASMQDWQEGAAKGAYQDYFQGPIVPNYNDPALKFQATEANAYQFDPSDFDVATFRAMATGDLLAAATQQAQNHNPDDPASPRMDLSGQHREPVPYGAAYPYDYYERPVFENMTFENVRIPKGLNALFKNCRFIGVTFIETETDNEDPNFAYAGMLNPDGTPKHPGLVAMVKNPLTGENMPVADTKTVSNNIRFDNCVFEGAVVSDAPRQFTQTRNKVAFTGRTQFQIDDSTHLDAAQKALFKRSTLLMPHYSVEMGTFISPTDPSERLELSGTIVGGVVDMRGQIRLEGSLITTFEPQAGVAPVLGDTSPQFNTTLGYFASSSGDLEAELPADGLGVIQIRYDPRLAMPDGIRGPVEIKPLVATYYEGVAP